MIPILFDEFETEFISNGLGRLTDAIKCTVTEERNGIYELSMVYPLTGIHYKELTIGRYIACSHDDRNDVQPFEIYAISAPIGGRVTFSAHHISYKLGHVIVKPFTASSCAQVFATLPDKALTDCPFEFWTDKDVSGPFEMDVPISIKELLGGTRGSVLDVYGKADYEWDKWDVKLYTNRGRDTGVEIRYGKNLKDARHDTTGLNVYNAVVPYWAAENIGTVTLPEGIVAMPGLSTTETLQTDTGEDIETDAGEILEGDASQRVIPVPMDLSSEFETEPTEEQLRNRARTLLEASEAWIPGENVTVDFVALWQTEEYKDFAPLQRVALCDKVSVYYPELGIDAVKKQVIRVAYNVLTDRYDSIELGTPKTSFAAALRAETEAAVLKRVPSKSYLNEAIDHATQLITGGYGGHVIFGLDADGKPNEILIMDTDDPATAVNVWRFNSGGLGHSHSGYDGPFDDVALTQDGKINANMITAGTMNANIMRTGIISDKDGKNYWNLDTGEISISLDPGDVGAVTPADLARVENNARNWASNAESSAKDYTDNSLQGYATTESVTGAINANNTALRTEFSGIYATKADEITDVQTWYYQSTSPTQLFGGSWTPDAPEWVDGMYIWTKTRVIRASGPEPFSDPICISGNTGIGLPGEDGKDALNLYITAEGPTITAKDKPVTVTMTAHVGQGESLDIDPAGVLYAYGWFLSADGTDETFYGTGKTRQWRIDENLLTDSGSVRFALMEVEDFYLETDAGETITDDEDVILEVD